MEAFFLLTNYTPSALTWPWGLLVLCFAAVYTCKLALHITKDEISGERKSLIGMTFALWGISVGACRVTNLLMMLLLYSQCSYFYPLFEQYLCAPEERLLPSIVFYIIMAAVYGGILMLSKFCFRAKIADKKKRSIMTAVYIGVCFIAMAAAIALFMSEGADII